MWSSVNNLLHSTKGEEGCFDFIPQLVFDRVRLWDRTAKMDPVRR